MENNELMHHGILGQKWGVRRTPAQLSTSSSSEKKSTSASNEKAKDKKESSNSSSTKTVKELTDDELREKISRMELEKKYKDLSKTSATNEVSRGKKFAMDVLEDIGKKTLSNLGTQAANHFLGNAINKIGGVDSSDAAKRIVNPQKGQTDKK